MIDRDADHDDVDFRRTHYTNSLSESLLNNKTNRDPDSIENSPNHKPNNTNNTVYKNAADKQADIASVLDNTAYPGALYCLCVLTGINLLNYIDRYVPSATQDLFETELNLDDTQASAPSTAFILVYMLTSPVFSHFADKGYSRKRLICAGVIFWSMATAAASFAWDFWSFLIFRSLVGVGEAAYATIAPALISEYYPRHRRNVILSYFYLAIPVGSAMGYGIGGAIGDHYGWRKAFLACGVPGIALALFTLLIAEPPRGVKDHVKPPDEVDLLADSAEIGALSEEIILTDENEAFGIKSDNNVNINSDNTVPNPNVRDEVPGWKISLLSLYHNPTFMYCSLGLSMVTFAAGGIANWFPTYLKRYYDMDLTEAGTIIGGITVVGGICGTLIGAFAADKMKLFLKNPYFGLSAICLGVTCAMSWVMLIIPNKYGVCALLGVAQLFLWTYTGPINGLTVNSVPANLRTRAFAVQIFLQHAAGDAISPVIVGSISDAVDSLKTAMLIVPVALCVGFAIWVVAWRTIPDESKPYGIYKPVAVNVLSINPAANTIVISNPINNDPFIPSNTMPNNDNANPINNDNINNSNTNISSRPHSRSLADREAETNYNTGNNTNITTTLQLLTENNKTNSSTDPNPEPAQGMVTASSYSRAAVPELGDYRLNTLRGNEIININAPNN